MISVDTIVVFMGAPGSGKGSLAKKCVDQFGWMQVSTGNLCRKHIAEQTKIGKEIDLIIKSGKLINDDLITRMVMQWLEDNAHKVTGIILDGYPRTKSQARDFVSKTSTYLPFAKRYVVVFCATDDEVIDRLRSRLICQNKDCQMAYSSKQNSLLSSKKAGLCDVCGGELGIREDDNEATIRKRLEVYRLHERELLQFYRDNNQKIIELDAKNSPQDLFEVFVKKVIHGE